MRASSVLGPGRTALVTGASRGIGPLIARQIAEQGGHVVLTGRSAADLAATGADVSFIAACPRTGSAWTSTGMPFESRGLKHRPGGTIRLVPIPPVLVSMVRQHLHAFGTAADGRLFRGSRGGMLSESVYGRAWHAARQAALGPGLAVTALARRPYDLRHAALSLWLNASGAPAEVAARAGTSAHVLHDVYVHSIHSKEDTISQQIEDALDADASVTPPSRCGKGSGYTHRRHHPDPVRYMYVNQSPDPRTAHGDRARRPRNTACRRSPLRAFPQVR